MSSLELDSMNIEKQIRPAKLSEYIGQQEVKNNLQIFIKAAKMRDKTLDHVLLYGPPGLGKTTLANIIANEMNAHFKLATGPSIEKSGDLVAILSTLDDGDVLFIDEIHRIPKFIEEILYSAMEDYKLSVIIGSEASSRAITIDLPFFTLIGATTKVGDLSNPLRDRFGIISKLNYYTEDELHKIVTRSSLVLGLEIDADASYEIARRSRGTPRIANRLLRRVSDFSLVMDMKKIDIKLTKMALNKMKVDYLGLDETDYHLLKAIITKFNGGPVGVEAIASSIGEDVNTIVDVYEPYLLQLGFIKRTKRGRVVEEVAYKHLGISYSK